MAELQTSVKDVESPQTVEVTLDREGTLVEGLTEETVEIQDRRKAYKIEFKLCLRCGDEVGCLPDGRFVCSRCRNDDQENFGKTTYKLSAEKVDSIINRKSAYKCDTCGKVYDVPTKCCIKNMLIDVPESSQRAFWCPKCKSVYAMQVACCDKDSSKLVPGTYIRRRAV